MRGFSKAIISGNLTRDPELRTTPSGAQVCGFSVAVNRTFKDASGNQQETVSFIDCTAWGKLAEVISQYAKKGTGVLVSGRLDQRSWEDKNSGQKRSRVEIVVEDFNFLGGDRNNNNNGGDYAPSSSAPAANVDEAAQPEAPEEVVPDDIPEGDEVSLDEIPF